MRNIHLGKILKRELQARNITSQKFSQETEIDLWKIENILCGKLKPSSFDITKISNFLGTTKEFWHNLNNNYMEHPGFLAARLLPERWKEENSLYFSSKMNTHKGNSVDFGEDCSIEINYDSESVFGTIFELKRFLSL